MSSATGSGSEDKQTSTQNERENYQVCEKRWNLWVDHSKPLRPSLRTGVNSEEETVQMGDTDSPLLWQQIVNDQGLPSPVYFRNPPILILIENPTWPLLCCGSLASHCRLLKGKIALGEANRWDTSLPVNPPTLSCHVRILNALRGLPCLVSAVRSTGRHTAALNAVSTTHRNPGWDWQLFPQFWWF